MAADFYPFMKVSLKGEYGVVTEEYFEWPTSKQNIGSRIYGVIRWDTDKNLDFEDWRELWGTFLQAGGKEIGQEHQFMFINNDGTVKQS